MKSFLRSVAILVVGGTLALCASVALGAIDERKLLILWVIFSGLLFYLVSQIRRRSPRTGR
ncbi:MAG TPA: hypothetical protein VGN48_17135 [Pedococcus sp.]|nr:hypothetical protein [Pedococcus sp.]